MGSMTAKLGILLRVASLAAVAWVLFHAHREWGGGHGRESALFWMQMGSLALIAPMAWFVSAEEKLPAVEDCVPLNRWLALLISPFLPGGGRGLTLLLLAFGLRDMIAWVYSQLNGNAPIIDMQVIRRILVLDGSILILLALPTAIAARWSASRSTRLFVFAAIVGIAMLLVLPPRWLPYWRGPPDWLFWGTPSWPVVSNRAPMGWEEWEATKRLVRASLMWGCVATLALNLPRIFNGLREVWKASAARAKGSA